MAKKGTLFGKPREQVIRRPGSFSKAAKAAGEGTLEYAASVLKKGSGASTTTKRRANLAKTFAKMRKKK